jgi:hypothetical protein
MTLSIMTLGKMTLSISTQQKWHFAECCAECHYAECLYEGSYMPSVVAPVSWYLTLEENALDFNWV